MPRKKKTEEVVETVQTDPTTQLLIQMSQTLAGIDKRLQKLENVEVASVDDDETTTLSKVKRKKQPVAIPDRRLGKNSHLDNFGKPKQGDAITNFDLFMKKVGHTAEAKRAERDKKIDKKLNKGVVPTERRPAMEKIKVRCENCKGVFEIEENLIPMDGFVCTECCRKG